MLDNETLLIFEPEFVNQTVITNVPSGSVDEDPITITDNPEILFGLENDDIILASEPEYSLENISDYNTPYSDQSQNTLDGDRDILSGNLAEDWSSSNELDNESIENDLLLESSSENLLLVDSNNLNVEVSNGQRYDFDLMVNLPSQATTAYLELDVQDADLPTEGELLINGQKVTDLFPDASREKDGQWTTESIAIDSALLKDGINTISLQHTSNRGFILEDIRLQFPEPETDVVASSGNDSNTYFVAPNGDDSNPGTIDAPLRSLEAAHELVSAGDTIYLRGGVYKLDADETIELKKSGEKDRVINLFAYNNEKPIFDASHWQRTTDSFQGERVVRQSGSYWHIQGLEITGSPRQAWAVWEANNTTFENVNFHHNDETALLFWSDNVDNTKIINSDFHNNFDPHTKGQNADGLAFKKGFGENVVIQNSRFYANSDDGVDLWGFYSPVTIENSWAYENGHDRWEFGSEFEGNGNGFKLAGGDPNDQSTSINTKIINSMAWENAYRGFDYNGSNSSMKIYNNTSYNNGIVGFRFQEGSHVLRNNISFRDKENQIAGDSDDRFNSWTSEVIVNENDFLSLDSSIAEGSRQLDGSLPESNFLKLRADSDLIDKGVDVGLNFAGKALDFGAYETGQDSHKIQAEDSIMHNVTADNNHPGYEGEGFANYRHTQDSYIEWNVPLQSAKEYDIVFRYANADKNTRSVEIYVNDVLVEDLFAFESTDSWEQWNYAKYSSVLLATGENNIRITSKDAIGGPNIDFIELIPAKSTSEPTIFYTHLRSI